MLTVHGPLPLRLWLMATPGSFFLISIFLFSELRILHGERTSFCTLPQDEKGMHLGPLTFTVTMPNKLLANTAVYNLVAPVRTTAPEHYVRHRTLRLPQSCFYTWEA